MAGRVEESHDLPPIKPLQEERQRQMHNARLLQQAHNEIEQERSMGMPSTPTSVNNQYEQNQVVEPPKPVSSLPMGKQKSARIANRRLVQNLKRNHIDRWEDLITTSIVGTFEIYEYIEDVGLVYAMQEAGADQELITRLIPELQKHPLVPETLNYGV